MTYLLEKFIAWLWNLGSSPRPSKPSRGGLDLGSLVTEGNRNRQQVSIPQDKRAEHLVISGRTGMGKSFLLRHMLDQDIDAQRGFLLIELHNDLSPYVMRRIAEEERRTGRDLASRLIIIEPGDPDYSVGFNPLENLSDADVFLQIAEFTTLLKQRWQLDSFGARTEELLRNTLHVIAANSLTLLEIDPLLTNQEFRKSCLTQVTQPAVRDYFEHRFDTQSAGMQAAMRDPILNKVSVFTGDPKFRHLLGQQTSTFSLLSAMDQGFWVVVNLDKGKLGEHAATIGAMLLTKLKNALFARKSRTLFTVYADEIQNLTVIDSSIDTVLAEARKFGVSICSTNQFLDQFSPQMRAAMLAIGTHICFQLASGDAEKFSTAFDGGRKLAELLRNLPKRQFVLKSGHHPYIQAAVPTVETPKADPRDLEQRARQRFGRRRAAIEEEINARRPQVRAPEEALDDWE